MLRALSKLLAFCLFTGIVAAVLITASAYLYLSPKLPPRESYTNLRLENPLRIYSADDRLIAEFGSRRSQPISFDDIPPLIRNALISTEDKRFYRHNGVDPLGLLRSVAGLVTGNDWGGGSTITMQVTKNFFFEGESAHTRKFKEILLALKMERELSKDEILELYFNKMFFGISAYGIAAAAKQYYDKEIAELTLAEMATLIGLLPRPNAYNPLASPSDALAVRGRVLRRMRDQGMIDQAEYEAALDSPITARRYGRQPELEAPYIAEMVRQDMVDRYGDLALTDGFEVVTTVISPMQEAANRALRTGLETYDRRHGYRGREDHAPPAADGSLDQWLAMLGDTPAVGSQQPVFVQEVQDQSITALLKNGESIVIEWDGIRWAKRFINSNAWGSTPRSAREVVSIGDLIRVNQNEDLQWSLGQVPAVNGGLVAIDPSNGAILSLVGGYDFSVSKFNRVTQARRQPGSNFKPFLYAAALENGYTAATLINDAPLARSDYRPENFNRQFMGPLTLKYALTNSKNLISLRLYDALGANLVLPYIGRFGFDISQFSANDLTVAIGSQAVLPLEIVTGYSVFANGGYKVEPHLIKKIDNFNDGALLRAEAPYTVCANAACDGADDLPSTLANQPPLTVSPLGAPGPAQPPEDDSAPEVQASLPAPRVIDERVAYIMNSILRSVITDGSGRPANRAMARQDIAGKTGTTNDAKDLWFTGFNGNVVSAVYVGFDQPDTLGSSEQAATVALPIWIDFMAQVLEGRPHASLSQPDGLVSVRINGKTGLRARPNEADSYFEVFREENVPDYDMTPDSVGDSPLDRVQSLF